MYPTMGHYSEILHYIDKTTGNSSVVTYDCNVRVQNTSPKGAVTTSKVPENPFRTSGDSDKRLEEVTSERDTVVGLNNDMRIKNSQIETLKRDLQAARRKNCK